MKKNFRFFDNRQKYLLFVTTTNEKNRIADNLKPIIQSVKPKHPALKIFDAGMGDVPNLFIRKAKYFFFAIYFFGCLYDFVYILYTGISPWLRIDANFFFIIVRCSHRDKDIS